MINALPISSTSTWSFRIYLARGTNYETLHYAVFSNLLSLYLSWVQIVFLCIMFWNTFSLYSSLNNQIPSFLYIYMQLHFCIFTFFTFFRQQTSIQNFWTEWQKVLPEYSLLLISSRIKFWFVLSFPNNWTVSHFQRVC
jgi:hypothetical protein